MADQDLSTITLPQGGNALGSRSPADEDGSDDCVPCHERPRLRAALVEMRRGMVSLERGLAALYALVESNEPEVRQLQSDALEITPVGPGASSPRDRPLGRTHVPHRGLGDQP